MFPLFSSKYLDWLDWNKAAKLILANEHYTELGIVEIDNLKSKMNNQRVEFDWNHLTNLDLSDNKL